MEEVGEEIVVDFEKEKVGMIAEMGMVRDGDGGVGNQVEHRSRHFLPSSSRQKCSTLALHYYYPPDLKMVVLLGRLLCM